MAIEYSLWVKQIATEGKTQVVPRQPLRAGASELQPGRRVHLFRAAARRGVGGFVLSRVPALGGLETPILDDVDSPISFSPDGREFVFHARRRQRVHDRRCRCRRRLSTDPGDARVPARVLVFRAGLVPRRQSRGGVRDRSGATARSQSFFSRWTAAAAANSTRPTVASAVSAGCPTDRGC